MSLVDIVREDLTYLQETIAEGAAQSLLRQHTATLRRLLLDKGGAIPKVRRSMGHRGEATVSAHRLADVLATLPTFEMGLVTAGPHRYNGRTVGSWMMMNTPIPEKMPGTRMTDFVLSHYLRDPGMCVDGRCIKRGDIVTYVANKLGGVHFDETRNRRRDEVFEFLDRSGTMTSLTIDGYMPIYLEIGAIGQALIRSASIMEPLGLTPSRLVPGPPSA